MALIFRDDIPNDEREQQFAVSPMRLPGLGNRDEVSPGSLNIGCGLLGVN